MDTSDVIMETIGGFDVASPSPMRSHDVVPATGGVVLVLELQRLSEAQHRIEQTLADVAKQQLQVAEAVADMRGFLGAIHKGKCVEEQETSSSEESHLILGDNSADDCEDDGGDSDPLQDGVSNKSLGSMRRGVSVARSSTARKSTAISTISFAEFSNENRALEPSVEPSVSSLPEAWPSSLLQREGIRRVRVTESLSTMVSVRNSTMKAHHAEAELTAKAAMWMRPSFMLHPQNWFKVFWDMSSVVILVTDLTLIPVILAWDIDLEGVLLGFSLFTSTFWAADVVVSVRSGFYYEGGDVEMRPWFVLRRYLAGPFLIDAAILLADWLSLVSIFTAGTVGTSEGFTLIRIGKATRILRIFALLRMVRLARVTDDLLDRYVSHELRLGMRIIMILLAFMWINHMISCLWFALGRYSPSDTGTRWTSGEVSVGNTSYVYDGESRLYQYATSLHWSIAQMTLGAMEVAASNTAERFFNITMIFFGLLFSSTLVSSLSATMIDLRMQIKVHNQTLRSLRQFLRQHDVQADFSHRVTKAVVFRLKQKDPLHEKDVPAIGLLSVSMRSELRYHLCKDHLVTHPFFHICSALNPEHTAQDVCSNATEISFLQRGDDLFLAGNECNNMYYLISGKLDYAQLPDTSPVEEAQYTQVIAGAHAWLCEAAMWTKWIHVGSATADVPCQTLILKADVAIRQLRKHRVVEEFTQSYAALYLDRVRTATSDKWPNDIDVAGTVFGELIASMDHDMQVGVSLEAFLKLSQRGMFRLFHDMEHLRREIVSGECALWINNNEPERVVKTLVFSISRDHDGSLLMELAKVGPDQNNVRTSATVQLPGGKLKNMENIEEAAQRLFEEKLQPLTECVRLVGFDNEVVIEESPSVKIRTRYVKIVCHMELTESFDAPVVKPRHGIRLSSAISRSSSFRNGTASPVGLSPPLWTTQGSNLSNTTLRPEVYRIAAQKSGLYAWLSPDEVVRFKRYDKKEAQEWLNSLDLGISSSISEHV